MPVVISEEHMFENKLCFVKQPHSEISILANAKDIMAYYDGLYPTRNATFPDNDGASVGEWPHENWKPEEGYCRLRLDCLNSFDGKNFVNFNINPGNASDTQPLEDFEKMAIGALNASVVSGIVDMLVDNPPGKSFSQCIIELLASGKAKVVQSQKWVFCRKPKLPSELIRKGLYSMTKFRRKLWHHYSQKEDSIREGMSKNNQSWQIPCADFGGISQLSIPLTDLGCADIFDGVTVVPYTDGMVRCYESEQTGITKETLDWARNMADEYLVSRFQPAMTDEKFEQLSITLQDLFDRKRGEERA